MRPGLGYREHLVERVEFFQVAASADGDVTVYAAASPLSRP